MIQRQHTIIGCINLCFTHVLLHYNRKLFITLIRIHKLPRLHPKELKLVIDTRIYSLLSFNDMCAHTSNKTVDIHQRITYYSKSYFQMFKQFLEKSPLMKFYILILYIYIHICIMYVYIDI